MWETVDLHTIQWHTIYWYGVQWIDGAVITMVHSVIGASLSGLCGRIWWVIWCWSETPNKSNILWILSDHYIFCLNIFRSVITRDTWNTIVRLTILKSYIHQYVFSTEKHIFTVSVNSDTNTFELQEILMKRFFITGRIAIHIGYMNIVTTITLQKAGFYDIV